MLVAGIGLIIEHDIDAATRNEMDKELGGFAGWPDRHLHVPNGKHVWWAYDLFTQEDFMVQIGYDYVETGGKWELLCHIDSNGDGLTNGQSLGDPCCRWKPGGGSFSLDKQREYRRWHLQHPAEKLETSQKNMKQTKELSDAPVNCKGDYNQTLYEQQFLDFYFHRAGDGVLTAEYGFAKFLGLIILVSIFLHWVLYKDLLPDLIPWRESSKAISFKLRIAVFFLSFFYMDITSGIVHLVLDYAPFKLPGLGILAKGFQFHHHDPTAIIRISWFEYVSHIHLLCPLIQVAVVLSDASRTQRLFWAWCGVWAHLFQTAHRWAHMPPETLSWVVRSLQSCGLLLSHKRHMSHHEDLDQQFTILSGHSDFLVDSLSNIVSPTRYDWWFLFGVLWFLVPIFSDVICRDAVQRLQGSHVVCQKSDFEDKLSA